METGVIIPGLSSTAEPTPGVDSVGESPEFSSTAANRLKPFVQRCFTEYRSPASLHELQKFTVYGRFVGEPKLRVVRWKWWIRAELVLVLPIASEKD